jgi:hypothetical protein
VTYKTLCLFIYSLFVGTFNSSDYVVSNDRMILNHELERMWKEDGTIMAFGQRN